MRKTTRGFFRRALLICVNQNTIMDQEYTSSVAVEAAGTPDRLLLVLYEDLFAHTDATMELAYKHIGLQPGLYSNENRSTRHALPIFKESIANKAHFGLCDLEVTDVNCTQLDLDLHDYPCLRKQLYATALPGLAWSMPMNVHGEVDLQGDCFPLTPFGPGYPRRLESLYYISATLRSMWHQRSLGSPRTVV
jgi:hypothetical protein